MGADVALLHKPVSLVNVGWIDRVATGETMAQLWTGVGILFNFNAFQRYNRIVQARAESGLDFSPQLAADGSHLGLALD